MERKAPRAKHYLRITEKTVDETLLTTHSIIIIGPLVVQQRIISCGTSTQLCISASSGATWMNTTEWVPPNVKLGVLHKWFCYFHRANSLGGFRIQGFDLMGSYSCLLLVDAASQGTQLKYHYCTRFVTILLSIFVGISSSYYSCGPTYPKPCSSFLVYKMKLNILKTA